MRHSTFIVMTGTAGLVAGATMAVMPAPVLEWAVGASGLNAWVPMAAPPIGMTFRTLASGVAAFVVMSLTAWVLPGATMNSQQGMRNMGFALARLTNFARGRHRQGGEDEFNLRRADAHPDAAPRRPLSASRDLGEPGLMSCAVAAHPASAMRAVPAESDGYVTVLDMPCAPEPMPWEAIKAEIARARGWQESILESTSAKSLEDLTIADLTARFEAGLQRRRAAGAAVPMAEAVGEEANIAAPEGPREAPSSATITSIFRPAATEADLYAALAALRGVTARAG